MRLSVVVLSIFAALTACVTYPQVAQFTTSVPYHSDPFFSMWRLGWVAHELLRDPRHLFEANIFFPAQHTLAYSDAMLLPAVLLAPLFWIGVGPVAIYNFALFAALTVSGFTAFLLARRLTGSVAAGLVGGTIYAFAPYRFDHYMHLELQIVFWIPLALLLVHRIVEEDRLVDGLLLGGVVAAQALSSVYAAVFFVVYSAVFTLALAVVVPARRLPKLVLSLLIAASVTLAAVAPYSLAYVSAQRTVGTRTLDDVGHYGATARNYLAAPAINRLYGWTSSRFGGEELNLFPGLTALVLGALGIVASKQRVRLAYVAALAFAIEISRGLNGLIYPWLFQFLPPFRALRSPARIDILINLSIAILAAYGMAWLIGRMRSVARRAAAATAIVAVLIVEYASAPQLAAAPGPTRVDSWLARQPPIVIVELPVGRQDWLYMYQGLQHRQRMLNGYSGYVPASYYVMLDAMRSFPDDRSVAYLRNQGVDYVIVRGDSYRPEEWSGLLDRLKARADFSLVSMFMDEGRGEGVYRLQK